MHARVLITNGSRSIDFLWVQHTGSDVYWGQPRFDWKRSYHGSGRLHTKAGDRTDEIAHAAPLAGLKGYFHLITSGMSSPSWIDSVDPKYDYRGSPADVLLTVDLRTMPKGATLNVGVGLLEPGNLAALVPFVQGKIDVPGMSIDPTQVLIATSVSPWVVATVNWITLENGSSA